MQRLDILKNQLVEQNFTSQNTNDETVSKLKKKNTWFKENGWGYNDTEFALGPDGIVRLTGKRYSLCGEKLHNFRPWAEQNLGLDISKTTPAQKTLVCDAPILNQKFLDELKGKVDEISLNDNERIFHSHGHSMQEIFKLRYGKFERVVDCVVYINSHKQAEAIMKVAIDNNVVLIPYGGGTNVTQALMCPTNENRMIVSVDTSRMNNVKWVNKKNMMACIESGIIGQDLERELSRYGVVLGHEPDSFEFSSLGGWVSTRASGMKKNRYGNIDDIVINIKIVTPQGTFTKSHDAPRVSSGPDLNEMILGHEGLLGIITEVIVKVKAVPKNRIFDSILFHDFETGYKFMYEVAMSKIWPSSLRLVDNTQFQFGMALKTESKSKYQEYIDKAKKYYVTQVKNFDPMKMTLATVLFEGSDNEVQIQQRNIYDIAAKYNGMRAGKENGERGYFLTYVIAYLRDFALLYSFIAESFETSVPWSNVQSLCKNVNQRIIDECKKHKIKKEPFISFRITQLYDTGAAVYIYFGFLYDQKINDPVFVYEEIENAAREEIMKSGGCISHHHGVGKLRKQFMNDSIGQTGVKLIKQLKQSIDPTNILANGNLV